MGGVGGFEIEIQQGRIWPQLKVVEQRQIFSLRPYTPKSREKEITGGCGGSQHSPLNLQKVKWK